MCNNNQWAVFDEHRFVFPTDMELDSSPLLGSAVNAFACNKCGFVALFAIAEKLDSGRRSPAKKNRR